MEGTKTTKPAIEFSLKKTLRNSLILLLTWILTSLGLFLFSDNLIFKTSYSDDLNIQIPHDSIMLKYGKNREGELHMIRVRNQESNKIIIYLHGNAGGIDRFVNDAGIKYNMIAPSYPGYYKSNGKASEKNIYKTVDLSVKYLRDLGFEDKNITVFGASLGASAALYAAATYPNLEKVIIVGAFDSIKSMCKDQYKIFCIFAGSLFNNEKLAIKTTVKIRQFHSKDDEIVAYKKGRKLFQSIASKDKKFYSIKGGHSNFSASKLISID